MSPVRSFAQRLRQLGVAAGVGAALTACTVGPDFHRPVVGAAAGYAATQLPRQTASGPAEIAGARAQRLAIGADVPADWWRVFGCPELDRLTREALEANPDLESARAALRVARAQVQVQRAGLLPNADVSVQASREKDSQTLSPTLNSPLPLFSLYTAQLAVSYAPDAFGGVRRNVENAQALAEQQRYELEASHLTIASNVALAVIQAAGLQAQIDAYERQVTIDQRLLQLTGQQRQLGQLAQSDVSAQVAALAQAQAQLEPLRHSLAQQRDLLATLTGRTPAELRSAPIRLVDLKLPDALPVSLPAAIVEHRPDVRAAEANVHAASAAVGVAIAARLPSFTLSANGGGASTGLGSVITNPNQLWTLAGGLAQPLFHGGELRARQRSSEAALDQAKAQYRSTVLQAFQNVADVLDAVQIDAASLAAAAAAERATAGALLIARNQQRLGQSSGVQVMLSEQNHDATLETQLQAQTLRFTDTVALYQALGGGWWNRQGPA